LEGILNIQQKQELIKKIVIKAIEKKNKKLSEDWLNHLDH
jgi:hypothetical protein